MENKKIDMNTGSVKNRESFDNLEISSRSLLSDAMHRFFKNYAAMISIFTLIIIVIFVCFGQYFIPFTYDQPDWSYIQTAPSFENSHYLGTDSLGRDILARVINGGKISLMVGFLGALVAVSIGIFYGAISGFIGGKTDSFMMRSVDILASFPFMFFVILLVTFFGRNIGLIFVAIGAVSWIDIARIVRGQTMNLKNKEFIEAAHMSGTSNVMIIIRHIMPNTFGLVVVYATLLIPNMILFESFLSFLGLGVQAPQTSWGSLVNEGSKVISVAYWTLLYPGIFLVITLFSFNFIGDGLRDAFDPKDR